MSDHVEALERLMQSVATADKLRTKSNEELADLLREHVWADCPLDSAMSGLIGEVMDRLRGMRTCPNCCGYGYERHVRCNVCDGTGDVVPVAP